MNLDTLLWVLAAAVPLVMAAIGGHVSSSNRAVQITFWALGILGVVIVVIGGIRNQSAQAALQTQLNSIQGNTQKNLHTHAQFGTPVFTGLADQLHPRFIAGKPVAVNANVLNIGQQGDPLADAKLGGLVLVLPVAYDGREETALATSQWDENQTKIIEDRYFGSIQRGSGSWASIRSNNLTVDDVKKLNSYPAKEGLCILTKLDWHDESGHYETDNFMCSATEDDGYHLWHDTIFTNREKKLGNE